MAETKGLMTAEEDQKVFNEIEAGYVVYPKPLPRY